MSDEKGNIGKDIKNKLDGCADAAEDVVVNNMRNTEDGFGLSQHGIMLDLMRLGESLNREEVPTGMLVAFMSGRVVGMIELCMSPNETLEGSIGVVLRLFERVLEKKYEQKVNDGAGVVS